LRVNYDSTTSHTCERSTLYHRLFLNHEISGTLRDSLPFFARTSITGSFERILTIDDPIRKLPRISEQSSQYRESSYAFFRSNFSHSTSFPSGIEQISSNAVQDRQQHFFHKKCMKSLRRKSQSSIQDKQIRTQIHPTPENSAFLYLTYYSRVYFLRIPRTELTVLLSASAQMSFTND